MSDISALAWAVAGTAFVAEVLYGLITFGGGITFNVAIHLLHIVGLADGTIKSAVLALAIPEAAVGCVQTVVYGRGCNLRLFAFAVCCMGGSMVLGIETLLLLSKPALIWRATSALLRFVVASARLAFLVARRAVVISGVGDLVEHSIVVAAALLGLALGNRLAGWLDARTQHRLILFLLSAGSLLLATSGVEQPPLETAAVWLVVGASAALTPCVLVCRWRARVRSRRRLFMGRILTSGLLDAACDVPPSTCIASADAAAPLHAAGATAAPPQFTTRPLEAARDASATEGSSAGRLRSATLDGSATLGGSCGEGASGVMGAATVDSLRSRGSSLVLSGRERGDSGMLQLLPDGLSMPSDDERHQSATCSHHESL